MATLEYNGQTLNIHHAAGVPVVQQPCSRCGGSGHYSYNLQDGTKCYGCNGHGTQYVKASTIENRIKKQEREERQRKALCGYTQPQINLMCRWAEARAAERKALCGYTQQDINIMIDWYKSQAEARKQAAKQASADILDWIGEPGQRLELDVIVERIIDIDGYYGTTHMHIMRDESGNKLIWFCSGCPISTLGEFVTVKATVKKHEEREFRGIWEKSTVVNRVKEV